MKIRYWIPTIIVLIFIWGNSMLNGSISEMISSFIQYLLTGQDMEMVILSGSDKLLRKIAHFSEYLLLALCVYYGCYKNRIAGQTMRFCMILFLLVAPCDEWIQSFTDGRNASFFDVLLDWSGYTIGWLINLLLIKRWLKPIDTD